MAWEPIRIFQVTMGAASTFTSNVDLKTYYEKINLVVPTMASASDFYVLSCETASGTYRRVKTRVPNTASIQVNTFTIASGVSNAIISLEGCQGLRHFKLECTTANAVQIGFQLICGG